MNVFSRRNMLSSGAVNSLGDMVSPCPLLMLILLLSLCRCTAIELLVYISVRCSIYTFSIPSSWSEVRTVWVCTESKAFLVDGCDAEWDIIFSTLLVKFVYDVMWSVVEYLLLNQACSRVWFSSMSSLAFSIVLSWVLYRRLLVEISVCNSRGLCCFPSWRLLSS